MTPEDPRASLEEEAGAEANRANGSETVSAAEPPPSAPPPPAARTRTVALVGVVLLGVLILGASTAPALQRAGRGVLWLLGGGHDHATEGGVTQYYTCGMHPWVILPRPGLCPICSMELTPLDPSKFTGEITISPVVVQNIGVRTEPVVKGSLTRGIRTVGTIDYDETRVGDVNLKVGGWIERLHVDFVGTRVRKGQPLFELYSPELVAAQQEYLLARRALADAPGQPLPRAETSGQRLLEAARTKLAYYDIDARQLERLEQRGTADKTMTLRSPQAGVVVTKDAVEGMQVEAGRRVYRIADLSRVWVMVPIYEAQLPLIAVGQEARMTLSYVPGKTFEGKVVYLYPTLDKTTRQATVRLEFDNPGETLKPGMYATVEIDTPLTVERVLAPRAAVIDTGERQIAFVSLGGGRFDPRLVRVGAETSDGQIEILDGLAPGEQVVTSGQFLLDSEAKLRESLARMVLGNQAAEQQPVAEVGGPSQLDALPEPQAVSLGQLLDAYLAIGDRLAADASDGLAGRVAAANAALDALVAVPIEASPHFFHLHAAEVDEIRARLGDLGTAGTLVEARQHYADLSGALAALVRATGVPPNYGHALEELHCPMYRAEGGGAIWLQPRGPVRNPYYGSAMLECFDTRVAVPTTGGAAADAGASVKDQR